jgi:hypothetical protein
MRAKIRQILDECIINGIEYGLSRAHKHTDNPTETQIASAIDDAIWFEIDERFEFDNDVVSESALSGGIDVELIEEHEDGSATYRFNLTEKYADALLQNGILWAIVSGVTGVTIDKVLQDYKK